jgi:hypothetical protein
MSNDKLVSIEIQKEFDVIEKDWQEQVFLKLYVAARTSGFLADIPDRDWKTLCVLATFMDSQGNCFPSQEKIATALGVCRQAANERINSLLNYRWQGKPVVFAVKCRKDATTGKKGQRWNNNRYTVLPLSNISFGKDTNSGTETGDPTSKKPMSPDHDTGKSLDFPEEKPMSSYPDTGKDDTNKIHIYKRSVVEQREVEKTVNSESASSPVENEGAAFALPPAAAETQENSQTSQAGTGEKWEKIREDVREVTGADISVSFAREIAEKYPPEKSAAVLEELDRQLSRGIKIRGVGAWLRYALENDIQPDQSALKREVDIIQHRGGNNRTPRARPRGLPETSYGLTPEQKLKKRELIKSLYLC